MVQFCRIEVGMDSSLCAVAPLAGALREVLEDLEVDGALELELCIVEALNNTVEHAYASEPGRRVGVTVCLTRGMLTFAITDTGRSMPACLLERAAERMQDDSADLLRERGMGLEMLLGVMDEVRYETRAGVNLLVMTRAARAPVLGGCAE